MASLPKLALKNVKYLLNHSIVMKPLSLRRRKVRTLRIFKQPAFRRNLPTPKVAQEALEFIKNNFSDPESFHKFTKMMPNKKSSESVRVFKFNGVEFAVKDTEGSYYQGHSKKSIKDNEIRQFIKLHHEFFRKNKMREKVSYILRTPKLFGITKNYLLLEKINQWAPKTKEEIIGCQKALSQIYGIFTKISATNENLNTPQIHHFIPAGIYKGKVVFYTAYDYL